MSTTDFDFYQGEWTVANRRLKDFLEERSGWEEFTAVSRASRHWANFDEIEFPTMGFKGLTLRLYDTEREEWSLYWSNDRRGVLDPPVVGRFGPEGRGVFYGDDTYQGKDVRVRFLWSDITATTATWEQAFSVDGEETWLTNWVMESVRRG
ncbi:hypothetical protein OG905_07635 [Streptomyces sp. NBC_00322]|uniref:hypothetical protein n=1 Tax=Streptomyces sp. NBC_00322 TaxID=2975712 RepID=UPI002E289323|nr:hypothetical protein [Streptomyces sp. NBC_00322]